MTDTNELVSNSTSSEDKQPLSLFLPDGLADRGTEINTDFDIIDHHLRKFDRQVTTVNPFNCSHLNKIKLRKLRPIVEESFPEEPLLEEILHFEVMKDKEPEIAPAELVLEMSSVEMLCEETTLPLSFTLPVVQKRFLSGTIFFDSPLNDDFALYDYLIAKICR